MRVRSVLDVSRHHRERVARRLGHSVETLVSTYIGALDDEEHIANQRIDTYLHPHVTTNRHPTSDGEQM